MVDTEAMEAQLLYTEARDMAGEEDEVDVMGEDEVDAAGVEDKVDGAVMTDEVDGAGEVLEEGTFIPIITINDTARMHIMNTTS